jgi:uncharacterized glyoxalase superfamily protein PhnB
MEFPPACPEIPVAELAPALAYYRDLLGFTVDWADQDMGLAQLSRGSTRLFMGDARFRAGSGARGPIMLWLNLADRGEIDALHREWADAGVDITLPPTIQPWRLYEFYARDPDGNFWRVFYDFAWEERAG